MNRDWRKNIFIICPNMFSWDQCYFWLIFDVVCSFNTTSFHTTWTVKELRRHSQQQMFYPLPYRYHMIRLVKTFTGWDGVPVNHTHRDMTCIMLIWPHFCYSVSKRERKKEKKNEMLYIRMGSIIAPCIFSSVTLVPPSIVVNKLIKVRPK